MTRPMNFRAHWDGECPHCGAQGTAIDLHFVVPIDARISILCHACGTESEAITARVTAPERVEPE